MGKIKFCERYLQQFSTNLSWRRGGGGGGDEMGDGKRRASEHLSHPLL
jgi:hypothetical protein